MFVTKKDRGKKFRDVVSGVNITGTQVQQYFTVVIQSHEVYCGLKMKARQRVWNLRAHH